AGFDGGDCADLSPTAERGLPPETARPSVHHHLKTGPRGGFARTAKTSGCPGNRRAFTAIGDLVKPFRPTSLRSRARNPQEDRCVLRARDDARAAGTGARHGAVGATAPVGMTG